MAADATKAGKMRAAIAPSSQTIEERFREAEEIVRAVTELREDVENFPLNLDEAHRQLALQGLEVALARPLGHGLTRDQFLASVLLGRGMTYADTARAVQQPEGVLHQWARIVPQFRAEMKRWREALEDDIEARLYSAVAEMMMRSGDMSDTDQIRLLALSQKIAARPEDRARWLAEYKQKGEELALKRKELEAGSSEYKHPRVLAAVESATEEIWEAATEGEITEDEDL